MTKKQRRSSRQRMMGRKLGRNIADMNINTAFSADVRHSAKEEAERKNLPLAAQMLRAFAMIGIRTGVRHRSSGRSS